MIAEVSAEWPALTPAIILDEQPFCWTMRLVGELHGRREREERRVSQNNAILALAIAAAQAGGEESERFMARLLNPPGDTVPASSPLPPPDKDELSMFDALPQNVVQVRVKA